MRERSTTLVHWKGPSALKAWLLGPGGSNPTNQALKLAGLTALAQVLALAASPLLTRLYTPSQLGIFGVFGACVSLINVLSFFRYEQAIPLAEGEEGGASVMQLCQLCLCFTLLLLSGAVWLGGERLFTVLLLPSLIPYRSLLPVGVLAGGLYILCEFWLIRQRRYQTFGLTRLFQIAITISVQGLAGWWGAGVVGLIAGQIAGLGVAASLILSQVWLRRPESWRKVRSQAIRYRRFGLLTSWSTLIKAAALQGPVLILAHFYGTQVTGWFSLSLRAVSVPSEVFAKALARVFLGEAAHLKQGNRAALLTLFWPTLRLQSVVGLLLAAVTIALAPAAFSVVFGSAWEQAGVFARLLSIAMLGQFIVAPTEHLLTVAERQGLYAVREVMRGFLLLGPLVIVACFQATPTQAVLTYSLGAAGFELVSLALALVALRAITKPALEDREGPQAG